ncbi:MAG: cytochrome b/b6 domain-containing protein [Zavarzinia sp.]|nr:cytochrome b/b6 domain-containing protein [Zavarzinia sp.]
MTERVVRIFSRFERFWHWAQMVLIFALMLSGFRVSGLHDGLDFETAVTLHMVSALALIVLWAFSIFWHMTTGTWRHYIPTSKGLIAVARFYMWGIFKGERHPYRKAFWRKHNPLQALTYLMLKVLLFPAIWVTGLLYLGYSLWEDLPNSADLLWAIAGVHVIVAFMIAAFVIAHVYLLTVGPSFSEHVAPMITGFDKIDLTPEEEAYLEADEPDSLK